MYFKTALPQKVYLSCTTKGAEIYYITDLSCPCNLTGNSRIKYTGPIEINDYSTIIAYAVKDGVVTIPDATFLQLVLAELASF